MKEFLFRLFSSDFMPHGYCYLWNTGVLWLHAVSDGLIAVAYYLIPVMLFYLVRRRRDLPFHWMFLMFGLFIFGCGTTHLMEVWTLWHGTYRLAGLVKAVTAGASLMTAILLVPLVPRAMSLPSPQQLQAANLELEREISERRRAEDELQKAQGELELRVRQRTAELARTNVELQAEISERRRVESALRKSEGELRQLVEVIPQQIWSARPDGWMEHCNERLLAYNGRTIEDMQGEGFAQIIHPDDREYVMEAWRRAVSGETPFYVETRQLGRDGQYRWFLFRGLPLRDAGGRVVRWYGTNTDIDDRRRSEEALQEARIQGLEAEFDLVLAERNRIARELHDTLLQGFSGITLQMQALSARLSSATDKSDLEEMIGEAAACLKQARLSIFALRDPGTANISLADMLEQTARQVTGSSGVHLDLQLDRSPLPLATDVQLTISRIALEALTNAIRHAGASSVEVGLRVTEDRVVFWVNDYGRGFAAPHERSTDKGHYGLVGMKERARQIGAELTVKSELGRGTSVTLAIPVRSNGVLQPGVL
jgi:PAS domain S-box-containing protein